MPRRARYGVRRYVTSSGEKFDSKREADRYAELLWLEKGGKVRDIERQPRIPIVIGGIEVRYPPDSRGRRGRPMVYVADFRYFDIELDREVLEDVKMQSGHRPEIYRFKRALVFTMGIEIAEV